MEFLTIVALLFFIKSCIGIIDFIVVTFEDMISGIDETFDLQQLNENTAPSLAEYTPFNVKQHWFESLRYLVNHHKDVPWLIVTGSFLYYFF